MPRLPGEPRYELTAREKEVMDLVAKGLTNPKIARRLVITRSTVKGHVSHALQKLGAHTRAQATVILERARARKGK